MGAAERRRAHHRGVGGIPGHRVRPEHAGRRTRPRGPLVRPRLPVAAALPGAGSEPVDGDAAGHGEDAALHGDAVGVEIGDLRPGFAELEEHLLHHGKVRHWSEWWDQYVEQPLASADYDAYRQVMVLIGSLFRRLRPADGDRLARDEDRERYMWT